MSVTITKRVTQAKLRKILPRPYAELSGGLRLSESITVLVFDENPVKSSALRKALHRLEGNSEPLLCVGRDFTVEARQLANGQQAQILSQTDFGWTDERHEIIKIQIGSSVKRPDWLRKRSL
jgi:hypothetical protein